MTLTEQLDLTEHVFRSVRGWLHQLYPGDFILIERRSDEALAATAPNETTPPRPIWNLELAAGPTWAEHTKASSMVSYRLQLLRAAEDLWDAQRAVGRVVANATRPGGRIPLYAYNLAYPQLPDIATEDTGDPTDWPDALDVAIAPLNAAGDLLMRPSAPVTIAPEPGHVVRVTPRQWPFNIASRWGIYAAEAGEALTHQFDVGPLDTASLAELVTGTTAPTNVRSRILGLRVTSSEGTTRQLDTSGSDGWEALIDLAVQVQVPAILNAHLDAPIP